MPPRSRATDHADVTVSDDAAVPQDDDTTTSSDDTKPDAPTDAPADAPTPAPAPAKGHEYAELTRNLHGWGDRGDIIQVDPSDSTVQDMYANEHLIHVDPSALVADSSAADPDAAPILP